MAAQHSALQQAQQHGAYQPNQEKDACGMGFVAHIKGVKSHSIIQDALKILENLDHRGAVGADELCGDGAGILIQIPDDHYRQEMAKQGVMLPPVGEYGVGMIFLPKEHASRLACEKELERAVENEGQELLGWRDVPVNREMPMSPFVREKEPVMRQIFVGRGADITVPDAFERKLYVIRKTASAAIQDLGLTHSKEYYVPSMSCRTVVYKGLLLADQVGEYYLDLQNPACVSAIGLVHQRFSTNTFPEWQLAHPYRYVAHNGEINTVRGNFNWMRAREGMMNSAVLGDDLQKLYPLSFEGQSDTATFDNALELLSSAGYPLAHAVMMMMPEPWEQHSLMDAPRRAFYEYHASMIEPWDGPAAVAFTDGRQIGATLDRNGLRPARYLLTDDDLVVCASEAGVLPYIPESKIVKKWRLQPGKMFLVDLDQGRLIGDDELKQQLATSKPYKQWIGELRVKLGEIPAVRKGADKYEDSLLDRQQAFGYTQEDLKFLMKPMAADGKEAIGSMGNDSPLAVLSGKNKSLYNYFKQLFAQVTNPPIDPIREQIVMSLVSFIGPKPNLLDINTVNPPQRIEVQQPVLNFVDMDKIRNIDKHTHGKFRSYTLDITYPAEWGREGVEAKLASLCAEAVDAIHDGYNILIVSDKATNDKNVPIPALLALSAIHQHLVKEGERCNTGLVVETGSARETHHFALLAGYGAEAVHPYLALETVVELTKHTKDIPAETAIYNFTKAVGKGLNKVMSKMGISTYMSYCGAQIFEAVGLNEEFVNKYFFGTSTQVDGIGIFEVAEEAIRTHAAAFGNDPVLANMLETGGEYAWRVRGEEHMWTPDAIAKLQHSARANNFDTYKEYAQIINDQSKRHMTLRGLFEFKIKARYSIDIDEVEPATEIVKRFATGAMSLGSISTEAHTTLAIAMNRIGGKSNTGEGGEDPLRYRPEMEAAKKAGNDFSEVAMRYIPVIKDGDSVGSVLGSDRVVSDIPLKANDSLRSRIKQVASGRFGVTAAYLASADQIQIKMAQGAKPGEGGQLPGGKVSEYIGSLRYSVPGVGLISPPPHHDIYSIEDLAQLIHDLKNANKKADISVKLVSRVGVGTIAAGVSKCKADHLVIAGCDGGTGASPLSSIKHAGTPWELGLAETQQTLVLNHLRDRIRVQADGQMKTGRDVVIAALLGADEMGFATAPLVVEGCIMMRKCHLNTCPVGVATQDPELRKKFSGQPDHVVNYFFFVAEEVRELMAQLGFRTFEEMVGRADKLDMRKGIEHWKARGLDFSRLLHMPKPGKGSAVCHKGEQDHGLEKALDNELIKQAQPALESGKKVKIKIPARNINRSVGAMLSSEIALKYGQEGLPEDTIHIEMEGTGGQSFGAFLARGITMHLRGEANDYTGKGMSGGCIIVNPTDDFPGVASENIVVGNTVLYGATRGQAYFSGVAGERFAVRLSGATAVVEGVGDHGCEYMTGGTVVVLGGTGRNFAAGMSGGVAYVYDPAGDFKGRCNTESVTLSEVAASKEQTDPLHTRGQGKPEQDEKILKGLITDHQKHTGSAVAEAILADWKNTRKQFVKVFPSEYRRVLEANQSKAKSGAKA